MGSMWGIAEGNGGNAQGNGGNAQGNGNIAGGNLASGPALGARCSPMLAG